MSSGLSVARAAVGLGGNAQGWVRMESRASTAGWWNAASTAGGSNRATGLAGSGCNDHRWASGTRGIPAAAGILARLRPAFDFAPRVRWGGGSSPRRWMRVVESDVSDVRIVDLGVAAIAAGRIAR